VAYCDDPIKMGAKLKPFIPSLGFDSKFEFPYQSVQMDPAHMLFARSAKSMKPAHPHYCKPLFLWYMMSRPNVGLSYTMTVLSLATGACIRELSHCMFEWDPVDLAVEVAKLRASAPPGTYPPSMSIRQVADFKNLQFWNGKVRRRYLAPGKIEENLRHFRTHWVDGPKGFDPTSGTNVLNPDFSATLTQFQKMAAAGHLSGAFNVLQL
jgi:hypothetical protein